MSSATDELRRLLDERGVEWYTTLGCDRDSTTTIRIDGLFCGIEWEAFELADGVFQVTAGLYDELTPEQFIAATLGTRTLTAEQVMAIAGRHQPDYCSDTHVCFDWQAIADELNATLGAGTCHITDNGPWGYPYVCSECGASFDQDVNGGEFNYCPSCGRKVVDE